MLLSLILPAVLLASEAMAANYTFAYIPGFFAQDDPNANASAIGPLPDRFGLLDSSPGHWENFKLKIENLNSECDPNDSVKVLFLGRHGEGYHNVAEAKYGTPAWDDYWSKLDGDGTITWGPDALLTPLGVQQAQAAHDKWLNEIPSGIPVPTVFYSSPLSRAARTLEITWTGITLPNSSHHGDLYPSHKVLVAENCREVYGAHTCDKRHPKSWISEQYPLYTFNEGFTEQDELWIPDYRESDAHVAARALSVLNDIWDRYPGDTYISATAHGGFIGGLLSVIGRGSYSLSTGGVIVMVTKRTAS